jgi:hypothetical protein
VRQGSEAQGAVRDRWSQACSGEELAATSGPFQLVPAMRMMAGGKFAYSAELVPWSDSKLDYLQEVCLQVTGKACRLEIAQGVPLRPSDIVRRGGMCATP